MLLKKLNLTQQKQTFKYKLKGIVTQNKDKSKASFHCLVKRSAWKQSVGV